MSAATMQASRPVIPENKTKKVSPSLIAVYVLLIVLAVVWLLPVIYTVTTSFKSVAEFTSNAFNFLPAKWVLDNYVTLVEASASYPVLNWLGNSLIISTVFAVLSVAIVALAGFGYSRLNFKYRQHDSAVPHHRVLGLGQHLLGLHRAGSGQCGEHLLGAQLHEGHPEGTG